MTKSCQLDSSLRGNDEAAMSDTGTCPSPITSTGILTAESLSSLNSPGGHAYSGVAVFKYIKQMLKPDIHLLEDSGRTKKNRHTRRTRCVPTRSPNSADCVFRIHFQNRVRRQSVSFLTRPNCHSQRDCCCPSHRAIE